MNLLFLTNFKSAKVSKCSTFGRYIKANILSYRPKHYTHLLCIKIITFYNLQSKSLHHRNQNTNMSHCPNTYPFWLRRKRFLAKMSGSFRARLEFKSKTVTFLCIPSFCAIPLKLYLIDMGITLQ